MDVSCGDVNYSGSFSGLDKSQKHWILFRAVAIMRGYFYDYDKIWKSHVSAAVLERFNGYYELTVTVNTLEGKGNAFACDVPLGHGLNIVETLMRVTVNTRPQLTTKDDDTCGCGGAKRSFLERSVASGT